MARYACRPIPPRPEGRGFSGFPVKETDAIPPKTVYAELMEFGLAILFAIGVAWMYLTTPEQRQMIFGYIIFFTVIMSIIALFAGLGPSSAYGPYY